MWTKISETIRGLIGSGDGNVAVGSRKRKLVNTEEENFTQHSSAKKQRPDSGPEPNSSSYGLTQRITGLTDWIVRKKTSFVESYYFKKVKETPKKLVETIKGTSPYKATNLGEASQQYNPYIPPIHTQHQQQHSSFLQFQPPFTQTSPFRTQVMENKEPSSQVHSTPRSKYPQGYSFSKARHDVENFQFAKSKDNFAFRAPPTKTQSPSHSAMRYQYPPNESLLPSSGMRDRGPISHKSVHDRMYNNRTTASNSKFNNLSQYRGRSKIAAKESIKLDEKKSYADLLQQFTTTRIPGTAFGSSQIRQSSFANNSFFRSTILGSANNRSNKQLASSQQKSSGSRSSDCDSDSSMTMTKVNVEARRSVHERSIIDLTEKSFIEIQSARKYREQALNASSSRFKQRVSAVPLEELTPISKKQKDINQEKQGKLPQPEFDSDDPEIVQVITPPPLPKSPAQELLEQKLTESKYMQDDWISCLREKYSSDKRRQEREIKQEEIKCQFHKEKRDEFEQQLEENLRKKLAIAEREPPVLEEIFVEEEESDEEKEFPAFTEEHEDLIDNSLIPSPPSQVLSEGFRIQITRKDLSTLSGLNWLNDEVINFYMNMIMERGNQENYPSVHAFNTFFYSKILSSGHQGVKRWTRRIDIFSMDYIIVPVHLGMHWCLAVIDFRKKEIRYYDSMGGSNNQCLNALKQYLEDESLDKKKQPYDTSSFKLLNMKDIPHQMNGSDCGMFACKFAEYISRDAQITFSQEHMPYFRRRMVLEIVTKKLL